MKILSSLLFLPLVAGGFTTKVCFAMNGKGVVDALVKCYDEDWGTDRRVGRNRFTDVNGCVSVQDTKTWWENPDIYCQVYPNGDCFATTSTKVEKNHPAGTDLDLGTVELTYNDGYCGDFGAHANGCGPASVPRWLNDAATSVSGFADPCAAHDACYVDVTKKRTYCDHAFYDDMEKLCGSSWTCMALANLYYGVVHKYGKASCEAARKGKGSTALCGV
uniref:Phospholipase A2 n=1 Tax=Amphora coffeiformis TaxID=265554 RepID=A0A7S3KX86_9STRA|mmetsp:Transcript_22641/g.42959  ORF Transcript_22641/g.42959 Transcript_22641/m.42959 type:complete len:219 (+) Transcript_22641:60-716(+)